MKDATEDEARQTFARLKAIALRDRCATAATAALFVLVQPRVGCRPVELCGAEVAGTTLRLPNAKRADGQAYARYLDLQDLPPIVIEAIRLLTAVAPPRGDPRAFERWRNSLASSLARASISSCDRRLSLYSFRHVAISTWEQAGFSTSEIAALAGHLSLDTARTHYARGRAGWAIKDLPRPAKDREPEVGIAQVGELVKVDAAEATPVGAIVPVPNLIRDTGPPSHLQPMTPTAITEWFEAHDARIDDLQEWLARRRAQKGKSSPYLDPPDPMIGPKF